MWAHAVRSIPLQHAHIAVCFAAARCLQLAFLSSLQLPCTHLPASGLLRLQRERPQGIEQDSAPRLILQGYSAAVTDVPTDTLVQPAHIYMPWQAHSKSSS